MLLAKSGYAISEALLDKLIALTNGHPFYLQVLGEELCKAAASQFGQAPMDRDVITGSTFYRKISQDIYKTVIQETLFDSAGRLHLYFASQYQKHIKTSTSLSKTLISISEGHRKVSEIAKDLGQLAGLVSSFISRLVEMDILMKVDSGYKFRDPVFGL